jgi:probable HAF family extracellular repeat protein
VLLAALATAERALPLYSHRYSPKKFTQHQLFACLVLKSFLKTDYRGLAAHLADCPSLLEVLKLSTVPHYTTLQKAARRLLAATPARRLLDATVQEHMGRKRRIRRAAIDSTGLESSAASAYFIRGRTDSYGFGINDGGQVTGYSDNDGNGGHAFLYTGAPGSGGVMADLGTLGGESRGWGINANGQVSGESDTPDGVHHAFLYTGTPGVDGHMIDLDAWLDANNPTEGAKWTLLGAIDLSNTGGLITGHGYYDDGLGGLSDGYRAFLLDASSLVVPGDYNQNGAVDAADYVAWRKNNGTQTDYDTWRANFGQIAASGSASALTAVPEPASFFLSLLAGSLLLFVKSQTLELRLQCAACVRRRIAQPVEGGASP